MRDPPPEIFRQRLPDEGYYGVHRDGAGVLLARERLRATGEIEHRGF